MSCVNMLEQMLTCTYFKHLHCTIWQFIQEANYLWYLGEALTGLPGYLISLAVQNDCIASKC